MLTSQWQWNVFFYLFLNCNAKSLNFYTCGTVITICASVKYVLLYAFLLCLSMCFRTCDCAWLLIWVGITIFRTCDCTLLMVWVRVTIFCYCFRNYPYQLVELWHHTRLSGSAIRDKLMASMDNCVADLYIHLEKNNLLKTEEPPGFQVIISYSYFTSQWLQVYIN